MAFFNIDEFTSLEKKVERRVQMVKLFEEELVTFDDINKEIKSFYNNDIEDAKYAMGKGEQKGLQLPILFSVNYSIKTPEGIKTYRDDAGSRKLIMRARDRAEQVFSKYPNAKIWLTKWIGSEKAHEDYVVHKPEGWDDNVKPISEDIEMDGVIIDRALRYSQKEHDLIVKFLELVKTNLDLETLPVLNILNKRKDGMTYGAFVPSTESVDVYGKNRGLADVLRTIAHEYTHYKQKVDGRIPENLQHRDHELESDANTKAGDLVYMFGLENPQIYELGDFDEENPEVPKN